MASFEYVEAAFLNIKSVNFDSQYSMMRTGGAKPAAGDTGHVAYSVKAECSPGVHPVTFTKDEVKQIIEGSGTGWSEVMLEGMGADHPMRPYMELVVDQLVGEGKDEMNWSVPKAVQLQVLIPQTKLVNQ